MNEPAATTPRDCRFCTSVANRVIASNALAFAIRDAFPVTPLHTLVIPQRHVADFFGLTPEEREACAELIHQLRRDILQEDPKVEGFNIGMNVGEMAGQTIFHCHIHLIPRRRGDVANPRGGVRMVIPHKGHQMLDVCPFSQEGGAPER
jgi:diadenosine tetraphosphate (Ap4A) HIT family hydrolase